MLDCLKYVPNLYDEELTSGDIIEVLESHGYPSCNQNKNMKLYFNFKGNYIVAKHNGVIIDMRTGIPTDATADAVLNSYNKETSSEWRPVNMAQFGKAMFELADGSAHYAFIDHHRVRICYKSDDKATYVKFTGDFPRYFWKGLFKLIGDVI